MVFKLKKDWKGWNSKLSYYFIIKKNKIYCSTKKAMALKSSCKFDWRQLKSELFDSPPRPRNSNTFLQNTSNLSSTPIRLNDSNKKSTIFQHYETPIKVRNTNTYRSHIFHEQIIQKRSKMQDSGSEQITKNQKTQDKPIKSINQNSKMIFLASKFQHSAKQTKLLHNQSDIFNQDSKTNKQISNINININNSSDDIILDNNYSWNSRFLGKITTAVNENAKFDKNYAYNKMKEEMKSSFQNHTMTYPTLIQEIDPLDQNENIKRINHNFSDLFGQEYGAKHSLSKDRSKGRQIANIVDWTQSDSLKVAKDLGDSQPSTQRNKVLECSSVLDTHNYHQRQNLKKYDKISNRNDSICQFNQNKVMLRAVQSEKKLVKNK